MSRHPAGRAALFYLAAGSAWILLSDALVCHFKNGESWLIAEHLQPAKELLFLGVTTVSIFLLLRSSLHAKRTCAQELERVHEDLSDFSYTASHDLRAPVRAVTGCAGIIRARWSLQVKDLTNRTLV